MRGEYDKAEMERQPRPGSYRALWFELYFEDTRKALEHFEQRTDKIVLTALWDGLDMCDEGEGGITLEGKIDVLGQGGHEDRSGWIWQLSGQGCW